MCWRLISLLEARRVRGGAMDKTGDPDNLHSSSEGFDCRVVYQTGPDMPRRPLLRYLYSTSRIESRTTQPMCCWRAAQSHEVASALEVKLRNHGPGIFQPRMRPTSGWILAPHVCKATAGSRGRRGAFLAPIAVLVTMELQLKRRNKMLMEPCVALEKSLPGGAGQRKPI
ncbi:hypothetical protein LX32DRAFT_354584 [Colletotrichum zoysiae]|uniref:Uncharacterized protein n=1 Tax=Colletotrichum zoysiae TaxID=1216348 RepID=A0AAD9HJZ7_9PEZI|nr:hypothetical protein LX32DRAFT_354584 [Colletotrichum zoysiae]